MNTSHYKASWSMFLAVFKTETRANRGNLLAWSCWLIFIVVFYHNPSMSDYYLGAFLFALLLSSVLRPALTFHSSSYQLLMPYAKRYVFYYSVSSLLIMSLLGSLFFFNSLASMYLGFLSISSAGICSALSNKEWSKRTAISNAMFTVMMVICALPVWFLLQGEYDLIFEAGNLFEEHYLIVTAGLNAILFGLLFLLYRIANTKVEHNPHLSNRLAPKSKYLRSYKAPTAAREISSDNYRTSRFSPLSLLSPLSPLLKWISFAVRGTPTSKKIYPEELSNKSSSFNQALTFSVMLCALIFILHYAGYLADMSSLVPYISIIGLVGIYAVSIVDLLKKNKLIVYLRLQTAADSRANYMKQVANAVAMRQIAIMLIVAAPILLAIFILKLGANDASQLALTLAAGASGLFYIMAYTLWYLRMPQFHDLVRLNGVILFCILCINWLIVSRYSAAFLVLLVIGLALYFVSFNKWMRHEMEWNQ